MKLIETKCPNCGSSIKVESKKKKAECDYCGTSFLVEDNVIEVKHLMAGEISEEQEFINAETNLNKLKNYDEALAIYLSLSKRYVDNPEIWIGLLRCVTKDFTYKYGSQDFKKMYQNYWNSFIALADEKEINKYKEKYKDYVDNVAGTTAYQGKVTDDKNNKNNKCYLAVTVLGGWLGIHKFVQGKTAWGFLYLFTGGLFFVGWIYDIVQEYKKWPDTPQRQVVKWVLFVFLLIMATSEISYSFLATLLYVLAAILCIDVVWKKLNINKIYLRVGVPLILVFLALELGSSTIPESSYGTWVCQSSCDYEVIEIDSENAKLYEKQSDDGFVEANTAYYESNIYINLDDGSSLVFSYNASKGELCLLDEEEKCSTMYEQLKEEKQGS